MAVAFDAAASSSSKVTTLTYSHTVGAAGSDRLILVSTLVNDGDATTSSVTYAGVSLTNYLTHAAEGKAISLWRLVAPATGANDVVITLSGETDVVGGSTSWTGADQSPTLTTAVNSGNSATSTVDITSAVNDFVTDSRSGSNTPTVGAGQTERWNLAQGGRLSAGSTETGAATVTMSWSNSSSPWTIAATNIVRVGGAPAGINIFRRRIEGD